MSATYKARDAATDPVQFQRIGAGLLGVPDLQWTWSDVPEISGGWAGNVTGTALVAAFTDYAPEMTVGAAANSKNLIWPVAPSATIANGNVSLGGTGGSFYVVARMKFTSAIDAQTKLLATLALNASFTKWIGIGVDGATSTANFVLSADSGTPLTLGAFDTTNWHTFEFYRTASVAMTFARMDGGAWVSGNIFPALCGAGEALRESFYFTNGTTATARKMAFNFYGIAYPRAA